MINLADMLGAVAFVLILICTTGAEHENYKQHPAPTSRSCMCGNTAAGVGADLSRRRL